VVLTFIIVTHEIMIDFYFVYQIKQELDR